MRRSLLPLLAAALALAAAAPAQAAWTTIGSDLSAPATLSHSDNNDVLFWPSSAPSGAPGIDVPVKGQAIRFRVKGGTAMNPQQYARAQAAGDPHFDIFHFIVLRPKGDGTWRAISSSQDLRMPRIGDGATPETVTPFLSGANNPLCVQPGDRISVATVGGYVPTVYENGLPYQIFGRSPGAAFAAFQYDNTTRSPDGKIQLDPSHTEYAPTVVSPMEQRRDEELLMQVTVGTGPNARPACGGTAPGGSEAGELAEMPDPVPGTPGTTGSNGTTIKPPMATPLNKRRTLGKDRKVSVSVTCRPDGAPCAGTIELRVHKKRIGLAKFGTVAPGQTGTFPVKLTKQGVYYVKADSDRKMLTTVVATSTGGRTAGGKMYILPGKAKRKR